MLHVCLCVSFSSESCSLYVFGPKTSYIPVERSLDTCNLTCLAGPCARVGRGYSDCGAPGDPAVKGPIVCCTGGGDGRQGRIHGTRIHSTRTCAHRLLGCVPGGHWCVCAWSGAGRSTEEPAGWATSRCTRASVRVCKAWKRFGEGLRAQASELCRVFALCRVFVCGVSHGVARVVS